MAFLIAVLSVSHNYILRARITRILDANSYRDIFRNIHALIIKKQEDSSTRKGLKYTSFWLVRHSKASISSGTVYLLRLVNHAAQINSRRSIQNQFNDQAHDWRNDDDWWSKIGVIMSFV